MMSMEEVWPHLAQTEFEDAWATVMHSLTCADYWAAAGYCQPWARVVLRRLETLLRLGIWGARSHNLELHPSLPGMCLVPTRYRQHSRGWQEIHGGDARLCDLAEESRKSLCKLAYYLAKRPDAMQVMLWCLLSLEIVDNVRSQVLSQLRAASAAAAVQ